jgi:hypothetical protein
MVINMKPTKRTKATKKERGIKGNPVLDKLMKLKYLINDVYRYKDRDGKTHYHNSPGGAGNTYGDKTWVMEEIRNLRDGGWLSATKMKVANEMWNKYGE